MTPESTFTQSRWSLAELYPTADSPQQQADIQQLEQLVSGFEAMRPQMTGQMAPETFVSVLQRMEEIYRIAERLQSFAGLWFSVDTQNQSAQTLKGRTDQILADLKNRTLFFELWWKQLAADSADRLLDASGDYRYWLQQIRAAQPFTLSEPEEKIINLKNITGANALQTLYASITNRYTFQLTVDGESKTMTRDSLMSYARKSDPQIRAAAFQEMLRVYARDGHILGQIYQNLVRDWGNENVNLRGFNSPIAVRNLMNDIPDEVVETLMQVCRQNAGVFQRFFRLKARWLGMPRLRRYDLYAPLTASDKHYAFNQASQDMLAAFGDFDPSLAQLAQRVFNEQHLDSEVRPGKRGGAFCWPAAPDLTPWLLVNYQGYVEDAVTLAHEMGHAIHSMLAEKHTLFTFQSCLPLAETASLFGEMLMVDRLLKHETDETVRRDLLFKQVDDAYASMQRQIYFAMFEKEAHQQIVQGASVDDLNSLYMKNLQDQFGDAVELSDEFRWEWVAIPHLYNWPFYVYAYTFGQLLVLALYQQYRLEGESFKPRYLRILSAGGSVPPVQLLAEAGIDIRQASFWQGGYDVLASRIAELEAMPIPR